MTELHRHFVRRVPAEVLFHLLKHLVADVQLAVSLVVELSDGQQVINEAGLRLARQGFRKPAINQNRPGFVRTHISTPPLNNARVRFSDIRVTI